MGDHRRFDLFADFCARNFNHGVPVVEVASGNGCLHGELKKRGFSNITSWDRRPRNAKPHRQMFKYGLFDCHTAEHGYGLVIGMHPDEGTDHIIGYAGKHRVPFAVVPCCVLPSAFQYSGRQYDGWIQHLERLAANLNMRTVTTNLPMTGRNIVIAGWPNRLAA